MHGICENSELLVLRMKKNAVLFKSKAIKKIITVIDIDLLGISSDNCGCIYDWIADMFAKGWHVADQTMDEESVIETEKVIDYKIEQKRENTESKEKKVRSDKTRSYNSR